MDDARAFLDGHGDTETLPALIGRPTVYSPELAIKICELIASGKTMAEVAEIEGFPGRSTVFGWLAVHQDFQAAYSAAMQWRAEEDADRLMELATDTSKDYTTEPGRGEDAVPARVLDKTAIGRSELACKYLWKLMESRNPKKYRPPEPVVIQPPALPGQALPGDDAKLIGQGITIDETPMADAFRAWRKAAGK